MSAIAAVLRAEYLLLAAWAFVLIRLAAPEWAPQWLGATVMAIYVVLCVPRLRRRNLILSAILAAFVIVLAAAGGWPVILPALDSTTIFAGFFGTIAVLRATADRRPETGRARSLFDHMDTQQKTGAFLVGANLIGALLVVGSMAILAPILGKKASDAERRAGAESCLRGMCMAPLWSPFWIAMGVSYQFLPMVPLWQIMAVGLPLSVLGLVVGHLMFGHGLGWRALLRAVAGLAPIAPPVAVCAAVVAAVTSLMPLTTLQSVVVCTPILCALALAALGRRALVGAVKSVGNGIGGIGDEVVLVTVSLVLGRLIQASLGDDSVTAWIRDLALPPESLIAVVVIVMTAGSLVGLHQLVTITVLLALLVPMSEGLSQVLLMEAALLGWAFASMVGITAVSVATAGAMFKVPLEQLSFGQNLKFVVAFGVISILILMAANRLLV